MSEATGSTGANATETDARYPIGRFQRTAEISAADRSAFLERIRTMPARLGEAMKTLTPGQLDRPYREGGWTARQVIHHLADSHMQAYGRVKMALTEDRPTIKPYQEAEWAKLPDMAVVPVEVSLTLLDCLHQRWMALMDTLNDEQWKRSVVHPERGPMDLETMLGLYAWHGDHHIGHVMIVAGSR